MSASSSGSDCCNHCGHALPTPGAKFCSKCGKPQRKIKKCVQCAQEISDSGTFCVHCGHDQRKPPALPETKPCIKCGNKLPSSAPFCGACGQNQSQPLQQQQQPCLYCGTPIPASSPSCPVCFAYTDPDVMRSIPLKQCINPKCQTTLMGFTPSCYKCNTNQTIPPQHSSPQSGMNPFLYSPAMFSMPPSYNMMPQMKHCANCRETLPESSDTCVQCQARQPMPTPRELLVMLQPFYPGSVSSYQTPPQSTPGIAARFPNLPTTTSLVQSQPTPLFSQHSESMAARFSSPPLPMADPNRMSSQSFDTRQVSTPSPMKGVTREVPAVVTTSTTTTSDSSLSATSTPKLSTIVTVPETTLGEDENQSKDATMGPVDNNSSMEVDTSKGDATPPSLDDPSAGLEPGDDPPVDHSSTPDISSSTSSVDKDVTEEQGLDIDDQSPVGSKRLSDDESSSEHSKRTKTDKDPDHEVAVAPSRRISKRQLSNGVPPTDQVKRSKTEEDLTASGKEQKVNEKPGASKDSPDSDNCGANELGKNSSGSTVDSDSTTVTSKTDVNNNVVDPALSSGAVIKEKVTESDSGINISDSVGYTPSENNGSDGDSDSEKKDEPNRLKPQDTSNDPLTIPSDAPHDDKRVQQHDKSSPETVPKVTEHTIEDKKEFEKGNATNNLDTTEPAGKRQGSLVKKGSSDDEHDVYKTPAGSPSLSGDENDPSFIAEEESRGSSVDKTSTLVPGIDSEQV